MYSPHNGMSFDKDNLILAVFKQGKKTEYHVTEAKPKLKPEPEAKPDTRFQPPIWYGPGKSHGAEAMRIYDDEGRTICYTESFADCCKMMVTFLEGFNVGTLSHMFKELK